MTMPYGVIRFYYDETDIDQRVPYATRNEMEQAVSDAVGTGFPMDAMTCWVQDAADADRLFKIMDDAGVPNARIFQLNRQNVQDVLNDFTLTIAASAD